MDIFQPNQTSASLLVRYAEDKYYKVEENKNIEKYLIIYDIFIKARSYYIMNKVFFFLALISGIIVLLWPSLAIFAEDFGWKKGFLNSAIVQTTVTGIAALTFAVYSHYKKRQMYAENLMRFAIFSEDDLVNIKEYVVQEMERIDGGFNFGKNVTKDEGG
jgi:hypothetical protein